MINDAPVVFDDPGLEAAWRPENYSGKFFGPTRLRVALTKSRNLVSIRLLRRIGIDFALEHLNQYGFNTERLPRDLSLSLGSGSLTPLQLASGYAVLANGGYAVSTHIVEEVRDSRGELDFAANSPVVCRECEQRPTATSSSARFTARKATRGVGQVTAHQGGNRAADTEEKHYPAPRVVGEHNVWIVNSMLRDAIQTGTGRRALALRRKDLAGKTGTTNDQHDAWFSGFVPSLTVTTWIGFDKLAPLGRGETGSRAALPMWIDFMRVALKGVEEEIPERPDGLVSVRIDPDTGKLASADDPGAVFETFRAKDLELRQAKGIKFTSDPQRRHAMPAGEKASREAEGTTKRLF